MNGKSKKRFSIIIYLINPEATRMHALVYMQARLERKTTVTLLPEAALSTPMDISLLNQRPRVTSWCALLLT
jgi:hypothetical protein